MVRNVGRSTIDRWLRVGRLPFVAATRLIPGGEGRRSAARLFVDRADATVRAAVGGFLNDVELRQDATRRRVAADERQRAAELRSDADAKRRAADEQLAQQLDATTGLRERVEGDARARLHDADRKRVDLARKAQKTAAAQARAVEQAEKKKLAAAEREAKRVRLNTLDAQAAALDQESDVLTARDEAQRLRKAAGTAKAARKGTA